MPAGRFRMPDGIGNLYFTVWLPKGFTGLCTMVRPLALPGRLKNFQISLAFLPKTLTFAARYKI